MDANYFESKKSKERAAYILESYNCSDLLKEQSDAYTLDGFIEDYNWDDGLEVPYFILNHPKCELGTALKIFYLGAGDEMLKEDYQDYKLGHWVEPFKFPYKERNKRNIKEAGWPELFIKDIDV